MSLRGNAVEGPACFSRGRSGLLQGSLGQDAADGMSRSSATHDAASQRRLGRALLHLFKMLEPLDLAPTERNSAATLHRMVVAMNLADRDRNRLLGDPDQVFTPLQRLLIDRYASERRRRIRTDRHRPAAELDALPSPAMGSSNSVEVPFGPAAVAEQC